MIVVREPEIKDIPLIDAYWMTADDSYLRAMGMDPTKVPRQPRDPETFMRNLQLPLIERKSQGFIIEHDGRPVGMAALSDIQFGKSAELHAHGFRSEDRGHQIGRRAFALVIKKAFEMFRLEMIVCEPSRDNLAPNQVLAALGFHPVKTYDKPASGFTLARTVNRYEIRNISA